MDIQKLATTLLSSGALDGLSQRSGASKGEVKSVLTQVLPALLSGADNQAKNADTSESFTKALSDHAKNSTLDLGSFLGGVDLEDGAKIIGHLLGSDTESTKKSVAKKTGVSGDSIGTIMSAAAPLLMSLLGQQADEDDNKDSGVGGLMGALLENVDVGELLMGLLTDDDDSKTTKKASKKSDSGLGSLVTGLLGKLLK